jgi:hypothetical protein
MSKHPRLSFHSHPERRMLDTALRCIHNVRWAFPTQSATETSLKVDVSLLLPR